MRKILFKTAVLTALTAAAFSLSACSYGGASKSSDQTETPVSPDRSSGAYENFMKAEEAPQEVPENGLIDSPGTVAGNTQATGRKLIRTVNMDVETDHFDDLLSKITKQVQTQNGYIEQSDVSGRRMDSINEPSSCYAHITARIPSDKLDLFIIAVEGNSNVINKSENTQDITLQYSDIESRKKSLLIEQERIWALLEKADTLESVLSLEERLSDIRYELESMESQLRLYDNQVDYSTVSLNINEVTVFTPTSPESIGQRITSGFKHNLQSASRLFISLFVGLLASSPIWLPIGVIVLLCLYCIRKRSQKHGCPGSVEKSEKKKLTDRFKKNG